MEPYPTPNDRPGTEANEHVSWLLERQSPDGVIIVDSEGCILEWNAGEEGITGLRREEAMGRPIWEVQHRLAPDERRTEEFLREARDKALRGLAEGTALRRELEDEIQRPDGGRRFVQSLLVGFEDHGRLLAGAICRDVTARKRAEDGLRRANEELAEADRRKNQFLATLAHELRNPLSAITAAVRVLQLNLPGDAATWRACDVVERQAQQIAALVEDLLDVARVTRGTVELRKHSLSVSSLFETAVDAVQPLLDAKAQSLVVSQPEEPLFLEADHVRMTQVLVNLLTNAVKFTPDGGEIRLSAERDQEQLVVRVRDTGHGIDATMLPHVFEPFVQAPFAGHEAAPKGDGCGYHGLGLGLSIVRALVEMHGGRVVAQSAGPGQGSEFVVVLPLDVVPPLPR